MYKLLTHFVIQKIKNTPDFLDENAINSALRNDKYREKGFNKLSSLHNKNFKTSEFFPDSKSVKFPLFLCRFRKQFFEVLN